MQPITYPSDSLASIEEHILRIEHMLDHHAIALAEMRDELNDLKRRSEWYDIQFSEMLRVLARDMRELRASVICSMVSDGPISAQFMQNLLRETPEEAQEAAGAARTQPLRRGN
ncbi:hypothetical protein SE17_22825 [Kouleothrix aurantiaca]|jgi:RNA processing factor Prp31|uniref:Uncharacterized protein n=1 Tax=Kouleothrix aurantiaca TaxID=186479 RepID=A0A0P9CXT7_9CHLR|nr:hypothetical protein SE17_22825 [Kouleothrix aurantiaca]